MYIDKFLQVSDKQAVTASAASTDVIDTGVANRAIGDDTDTYFVITVSETVLAAGAATVAFAIQDSADNVTFTDALVTRPYGKAELVAGRNIVIPTPKGLGRYVRAFYTIATGPLTAGRFSTQFTLDYNRDVKYPRGYSVKTGNN